MNKNGLLLLVIGLLVGFIAGYWLQEVMLLRQAPLRPVDPAAVAAAQAGQLPQPAAGGAVEGAPAAPGMGGDPNAAMEQVRQLRELVEREPGNTDAVVQLADMNLQIGRYQGAVDLLESYLEVGEPTSRVLSALGVAYRGLGRTDDALERLREAQEMDSQNIEARFFEVVILGIDRQEIDTARERLRELQQIAPGNPDVTRLAEELERRQGAA